MILFPLSEPLFAGTGADGISMFYVSCIVSQLVYSSGGSIFKGAVGSEMIEVVPFFHKMTYTIMAITGTEKRETVFATVITSYAISSILTGIVFFALGAFKLGSLVSFFPRHILIGCIGGVGFFLFVTGIEVSARLDGNLEYNLDTARKLFQGMTVLLWMIPLLLSILLMVLKRFFSSPYVVPAFFIGVAGIFYIVVAAVPSLNVMNMRDNGWIFPAVEAGVPFYNFYSYYGKHFAHSRMYAADLNRLQGDRLESAKRYHTIDVRFDLLRHPACSDQHSCTWHCRSRRRPQPEPRARCSRFLECNLGLLW